MAGQYANAKISSKYALDIAPICSNANAVHMQCKCNAKATQKQRTGALPSQTTSNNPASIQLAPSQYSPIYESHPPAHPHAQGSKKAPCVWHKRLLY